MGFWALFSKKRKRVFGRFFPKSARCFPKSASGFLGAFFQKAQITLEISSHHVVLHNSPYCHSYKTIIKWKAHSMSVWVNILHIVAVAPLLLYIGSMGYDTPRWAFEILAMLGFSALGYHIYSMILEIQKMYSDDNKVAYIKRHEETTEKN